MSYKSPRAQRKIEKKIKKLFNWFQKSQFWQQYATEYRELDLFTFVVFCKGLNISSFRIHIDWNRDYIVINIDTILPFQYNTEVGLGRVRTGVIKKKWFFAPYQRPPYYTEQRVREIIDTSLMQNNPGPLSNILNNDEPLMRLINKLPHEAWKTVSSGENSTRVKVHEIFIPLMFIQDENGINIRLSTHYNRRKSKADNLILGVLDNIAYKIRSLNLPSISNVADDIDALLDVYENWEADGFGKKVSQSQPSVPSGQDMKYCTNCGKSMEKEAQFCSACGSNF